MSRPGPAKRHVIAFYRVVLRKARNISQDSLAEEVRRHARLELERHAQNWALHSRNSQDRRQTGGCFTSVLTSRPCTGLDPWTLSICS